MAGEESPFERVPVSSRTEPSSGYTYEGQLERVGALATGLQSQPSWARVVAIVIAAMVAFGVLLVSLGVAGLIVYRLMG